LCPISESNIGYERSSLDISYFPTQEPLSPHQIPPQQKNHVGKENPSSEAMCKQQNLRGKKID